MKKLFGFVMCLVLLAVLDVSGSQVALAQESSAPAPANQEADVQPSEPPVLKWSNDTPGAINLPQPVTSTTWPAVGFRALDPTYPLRHYVSFWPNQPGEFQHNSCFRRVVSSSVNHYECRYVVATSALLSKSSSSIKDVSVADPTYGRAITWRTGVYEGCRSYSSTYWHCDFYAVDQWMKRTSSDPTQYYLNAFQSASATASCGFKLGKFWRGDYNWSSIENACSGIQF